MLGTTESRIEQVFSQYSPVERVKKIRDYAFVHFLTRDGALKAMKMLNGTAAICVLMIRFFQLVFNPSHIYLSPSGTNLDGANIEVTLAKPVDKDTYSRSPRHNKPVQAPTTIPTFGFVPVDYGSFMPALYSGYIPASPK